MPTTTTEITTTVEKIMRSSDAAMVVDTLAEKMKAERKKRLEFYAWINEDMKAEFINGDIVIHSPVKKRHWQASGFLYRLLSFFASIRKIGQVGTEKVMISLTRNDYEPDLVFFPKKIADTFKNDQVIFPAPTFVVEILSPSTAKNDKNLKKKDYALHGIEEYWIIDPVKQRVYQHLLLGGNSYAPAKTFQMGMSIKSKAVEGFEILVDAIFEEEANLKAMEDLMKA